MKRKNPFKNKDDPYRVYAKKKGKRDYVSFKSIGSARKEAQGLKRYKDYKNIEIKTKKGKTVNKTPCRKKSMGMKYSNPFGF